MGHAPALRRDHNDRVKSGHDRRGPQEHPVGLWAEDWNQPPIPQFLESLETATEDGSVILLHDGAATARTRRGDAADAPRWTKQGYTFQALPACTRPHTGNN